jgi:hypothetical protein
MDLVIDVSVRQRGKTRHASVLFREIPEYPCPSAPQLLVLPDEAGQVVRSCDGTWAEAFDREPERDICPEGFQAGLDAA